VDASILCPFHPLYTTIATMILGTLVNNECMRSILLAPIRVPTFNMVHACDLSMTLLNDLTVDSEPHVPYHHGVVRSFKAGPVGPDTAMNTDFWDWIV